MPIAKFFDNLKSRKRNEGVFFLFIHYSHSTYLHRGEITHSPFPTCCPHTGGTSQDPFAVHLGLSREVELCTNEIAPEK